jgi:23S rRNA (guanosine2251-2'-O)-methyltransferase
MTKRKPTGHHRGAGKSKPEKRHASPGKFEWIYGWHAVIAALKNPQRGAGRLVATSNAANRLRVDLPTAIPEAVTRAQLDTLLPESAVHQGIALEAPPLDEPALEEILADTAADAVVVVLDRVTDPHNVGAILRSAAAFAATAVIVQDRSAPPAGGVLAKAASGALDILPLVRVTNLARALEQLERSGFWRIGFDDNADSSLGDAPLEGRIALVVGAEGGGLRRLTRENCDHLASIDTPGLLKTLNVSNAAAVALYELARRNRQKD